MPKIPASPSGSERVTFCEVCKREIAWGSTRCAACGARPGSQDRERQAEVQRAARRALWAWDRFSVSLVVLFVLALVVGVAVGDARVGWAMGGLAVTLALVRDAIISALRARDREARVLADADAAERRARG